MPKICFLPADVDEFRVNHVVLAEEDRELVADQLAAAVGEDRGQAGEARPVLFAGAGREPSHTAPVREHGSADRCAGGGDRVAGGG